MTYVELSELFYYDDTSPSKLRWKLDRYKGKNHKQKFIKAGDVAGCLTSTGYHQVNINCKSYFAHRIVYQIYYQTDIESSCIDHINRDRGDNSIDNLRVVNYSLNQRNKKKSSNNTTGVTSVRVMYIKKSDNTYYASYWRDSYGKEKLKTFSVLKYGLLPAFRLAVLFREAKLLELNNQGAGYTPNHGK